MFLFHAGATFPHNVGEGEAAFDWRGQILKRQRAEGGGGDIDVEVCTKSIFVNPLDWMKGKITAVEGKVGDAEGQGFVYKVYSKHMLMNCPFLLNVFVMNILKNGLICSIFFF